METREIAHILEHSAERMIDLAKKLTDGQGDNLSPHEMSLVRVALFPTVQERLEMAGFFFLQGNHSSFSENIRAAREIESIE